jgi:hypothetical protein
MIYLATPYSHSDPGMMKRRFELVTRCAAWLSKNGHIVYSPITHGHLISEFGELPTDAEHWKRHNEIMFDTCSDLYILMQFGWVCSVGVQIEIEWAKQKKTPIMGIRPHNDGQWRFAFESLPGEEQ